MSLQINNLTLSTAGLSINKKIICHHLNISFNPGEFWGIMGINGIGKTTLLKSLITLYDIDHCNDKNDCIVLNKQSIYAYKRLELAKKTGMMLQEYEYNFPSTVLEAVLIGRHPFLNQWQIEDSDDEQLALDALKKVGLEKLSRRSLHTLSGGEKRRVNLATLLTQNPDYYLLDEPVNHLDIKAQMDILFLLRNQFQQSGQCGIMVIHEPNLAYRFCDHILLLYDNGAWLAGETRSMLTTKNLSRLYDCPIQQISNENEHFFTPQLSV